MAKGNMLLGYSRGKVGDVVFTRFNGQQVAKARNRNPKNPKSEAQCVQRMVQATIAAAAAVFKNIVDHSFEGVSYGLNSLSKFRSENMNWLRAVALQDIREGIETANFTIKGAGVAPACKYIMSKGTLTYPAYYAKNIEAMRCAIVDNFTDINGFARICANAPGTSEPFTSYNDFLGRLGLVAGDQITMVRLNVNRGVIAATASEGEAINNPAIADYARIVFKKTPDTIDPADWYTYDNDTRKITFTDKVVDVARSSALGSLFIQCETLSTPGSKAGWCMGDAILGDVDGVAIIRSQESQSGKWLRSNSIMAVEGAIDAAAIYVWPSYGAASTENLGSDMYLNNALSVSSEPTTNTTVKAATLFELGENTLGDADVNTTYADNSTMTITSEVELPSQQPKTVKVYVTSDFDLLNAEKQGFKKLVGETYEYLPEIDGATLLSGSKRGNVYTFEFEITKMFEYRWFVTTDNYVEVSVEYGE